jgi:predicted ABC-type ATPase
VSDQPRVLVIAGPNGGKTTFAGEFLPNQAGCPVFVNADLIAAGLENFYPRYAPRVDAWMLYDNSGLTPTLLDWSEKS